MTLEIDKTKLILFIYKYCLEQKKEWLSYAEISNNLSMSYQRFKKCRENLIYNRILVEDNVSHLLKLNIKNFERE